MLRPMAINVKPLNDFCLEIKFDNGESKNFDMKPYIKGDFFGKFADPEHFASAKVDGFTVVWPDGQDVYPDDLQYRWGCLVDLACRKVYIMSIKGATAYYDG